MRATLLALALTTCLAACAGGKKEAATPVSDDPVAALQQLRDRACACTDADCATSVAKQVDDFTMAHKDTKLDEAQGQTVAAAVEDIAGCLGKWSGAPEDERVSPPDN